MSRSKEKGSASVPISTLLENRREWQNCFSEGKEKTQEEELLTSSFAWFSPLRRLNFTHTQKKNREKIEVGR